MQWKPDALIANRRPKQGNPKNKIHQEQSQSKNQKLTFQKWGVNWLSRKNAGSLWSAKSDNRGLKKENRVAGKLKDHQLKKTIIIRKTRPCQSAVWNSESAISSLHFIARKSKIGWWEQVSFLGKGANKLNNFEIAQPD